jgi:hypothetical protein
MAGGIDVSTGERPTIAMNAHDFAWQIDRQLWHHARAFASPEKPAPKLSRILPHG